MVAAESDTNSNENTIHPVDDVDLVSSGEEYNPLEESPIKSIIVNTIDVKWIDTT